LIPRTITQLQEGLPKIYSAICLNFLKCAIMIYLQKQWFPLVAKIFLKVVSNGG